MNFSNFRHPLFPLLALVFERCEQATQCAEIPNSEGFNMDIQAFVQHQEKDKRPFLTNDAEVDGLVILQNIFFYFYTLFLFLFYGNDFLILI